MQEERQNDCKRSSLEGPLGHAVFSQDTAVAPRPHSSKYDLHKFGPANILLWMGQGLTRPQPLLEELLVTKVSGEQGEGMFSSVVQSLARRPCCCK